MKTVLTSIITSIITVIIAMFVVNAIYGSGGCMSGHNNDAEGCEKDKKECVDKDQKKSECNQHAMMMEQLIPFRAKFQEQLSDEEKATIQAIEDKFEDADDHENLCAEGMAKFQEAHKDDIAALVAIANNHQQFFDDMMVKMQEKGCCENAKEGEAVAKTGACPEAAKCMEATEKCKGEVEKTEAVAKTAACPEAAACMEATEKCKGEAEKTEAEATKCKEAEAKCKEECKAGMDTFKVHFLLMDDEGTENND